MAASKSSPPLYPPKLIDNFDRPITYLRLAVTDRCNLRCVYCMPPGGVHLLPREQVLSLEEMVRLVEILVELGISKVRITGGEPFVRRGLVPFLQELKRLPGLKSLHITTNGVQTAPFIPQLKKIGLNGLNLSLDTLHPERFARIARRARFEQVWTTFRRALEYDLPLKINCVVQRGLNEDEIPALASLARQYPIEVRFIEQMPFDGEKRPVRNPVRYEEIAAALRTSFPGLEEIPGNGATARLFQVPGFRGRLGIIGGYSRCFCATCNRLRLTAAGMLHTCLYDKNGVNLRQLLRAGASPEEIGEAVRRSVRARYQNGHQSETAQENQPAVSMASIGG